MNISRILKEGHQIKIRSVDNKDVSTCLKVEINYDEYSYKYSYIINDKECE